MALSANTGRALNIGLAQHGAGAEVATALDAATAGVATNVTAIALNTLKTSYSAAAAVALNTLKTSYSEAAAVALNTAKTSMPTLSELTTTTTEATTTWLHTALKSLVADMKTEGHMA